MSRLSTPVELVPNKRTIQQLLGHKDLATTMIDTHILQRGGRGVPGPLDDLGV